ncbi:MAG: metallophosphoesterase [Sedimentisphaerales bacterium]|nr:metallophosphoesterase [Sedimentisphaerales bacterium]
MRHRFGVLLVAGIVGILSFDLYGAGIDKSIDIQPLWKAAVITDTQTSERDWIVALLYRLKEADPDMLIHVGDTYFEWSDQFILRAVADLISCRPEGIEFHLAPGNHDMRGGTLKFNLREAATCGIFRFDPDVTFRGENYLQSRVAVYVPEPELPVWNPEIVNHPGWQVEANARFINLGGNVAKPCRYVFKRGRIRFVVCDWEYSDDQYDWLRSVITHDDGSSATIVLHHAHHMDKLTRYFEGLEGRHNVKLVLSGHDHRYYHEKQGQITYITGAGIARSGRDCDAMMLSVYRNYLRLDRYIIPKGASEPVVLGPDPIWMCEGDFSEYRRPESPRRRPAYVKGPESERGIFYDLAK